MSNEGGLGAIAIVGMAGRFPGARTIDELWSLIRRGAEGVRDITDEELARAGVPAAVFARPNYVRRAGVLDDADAFAASFFGFGAREAERMDPQHRLFLETAWESLEAAGHDPDKFEGRIGVFAGCSLNGYLANVHEHDGAASALLPLIIANDKDHLATRVSYKLNLRGPSLSVQTACSTSLVAVHLAWHALQTFQCDMALAGGVSVRVPQHAGYLHEEGGVLSPDGKCRPFDAEAQGTVFGSGVGVVVLRRLEDALASGDRVWAVIKGTAINNDGAGKVGYTAPSLRGQAEVIAEALAVSGVEPSSIGYVEAHGTGTALGDPIEIAALREAYGPSEEARCAVGSIKANVGHLDAAAGVTGLIKAVLAVQHGELPPSTNFERLNARIALSGSPFYINRTAQKWPQAMEPRRAAVSSFGMGGTNAHVVLEQAPAGKKETAQEQQAQLVLVSAQSAEATDRATGALAKALREGAGEPLSDVAYTLQERRAFGFRRAVVVEGDGARAAQALEASLAHAPMQARGERAAKVVWVLGGQGSQYAEMGARLYQREPEFRRAVQACAEGLGRELGMDVREALWGKRTAEMVQPKVSQPALFTVQYALMALWKQWMGEPWALLGHSAGEWAAACFAGVWPLETALQLVAERGRSVEACGEGGMLAVAAEASTVRGKLGASLDIAAINGVQQCVVGGPAPELKELAAKLRERRVATQAMKSVRAYHTRAMEPAAQRMRERMKGVRFEAPKLRLVSTVSGEWMTEAQAQSAEYWARQMVAPVQFAAAVAALEASEDGKLSWLEIGPGRALYGALRAQAGARAIAASAAHPDVHTEVRAALDAAGRLWQHHVPIRCSISTPQRPPRRVPLPTYPFDRRRYWIDPNGIAASDTRIAASAGLVPHPRPVLDTSYVAPRSPQEETIAQMWCAVLGLEQVGVFDDFFELGGDSLIAAQLLARISETFTSGLSVQALFEARTIAGIATRIGQWQANGKGVTSTIKRIPRGESP